MTEREALDKILALKMKDFKTREAPEWVRGVFDGTECFQEGIHVTLGKIKEMAQGVECHESALKSSLEELVAWEASPGMSIKWKYGDSAVNGFSEWADGIWTNAKRLLKWA